jgi:hypothetical protein
VALQRAPWALPVLRGALELPGVASVPGASACMLAPSATAAESTRVLEPNTTRGVRSAVPPLAIPDPSSLALATARRPVDPRWEPGAGNPLAGFCPGGGPSRPQLGWLGSSLPGPRAQGSQGGGGGRKRVRERGRRSRSWNLAHVILHP